MNTASPTSHSDSSLIGSAPFEERAQLDRTLNEIRSGRRLEKVITCIESFLNSQISRLEKGLAECERAAGNDKIVQRILSDFELEKQAWEAERQIETLRLKEAGEKLILGWEQLENERRTWMDQRDNGGVRGKR